MSSPDPLSLYIDTSCLLKLLFPEPESARVAEIVAAEGRVEVSGLARLEALSQIQGRLAGGLLTRRKTGALAARLSALLALDPFELTATPSGLDAVAERQMSPLGRARHCRTLDRLHLAAVERLGLRRLLTNDDSQAAAAVELGVEVLLPRAA
jgi:predicted nucleic acid-binding protein